MKDSAKCYKIENIKKLGEGVAFFFSDANSGQPVIYIRCLGNYLVSFPERGSCLFVANVNEVDSTFSRFIHRLPWINEEMALHLAQALRDVNLVYGV